MRLPPVNQSGIELSNRNKSLIYVLDKHLYVLATYQQWCKVLGKEKWILPILILKTQPNLQDRCINRSVGSTAVVGQDSVLK